MAWCLAWTRGVAPSSSPLRAEIAKHLLRALVGRFGLRYARDSAPYAIPDVPDGVYPILHQDGTSAGTMAVSGGMARDQGGREDGEDAAPQVMSYIMAQLRVQLLKAALRAGVEHVAVLAADALWVDAEGGRNMIPVEDDGWRRKGKGARLQVFAPRAIEEDGVLKAAGIPRKARPMGDGTWEAEVFSRAGTALRSGEPSVVRVRRVRYKAPMTDGRRRHLDGGLTEPYVVAIGADGANRIVGPRERREPTEAI